MASKQEKVELKGYAGDWIMEKKGTEVPTFLKFAYIAIAGGAIIYVFLFMNGEVDHADRGKLVKEFNKVAEGSDPFMYAVAAMMVIYAVLLVINAFKKSHE
jgi:hypothetical protein